MTPHEINAKIAEVEPLRSALLGLLELMRWDDELECWIWPDNDEAWKARVAARAALYPHAAPPMQESP